MRTLQSELARLTAARLAGQVPTAAPPAGVVPPVDPPPRLECATGKIPYPSKQAAKAARWLRHSFYGRSPAHAFRCGYCGQYHLGHRRGARF